MTLSIVRLIWFRIMCQMCHISILEFNSEVKVLCFVSFVSVPCRGVLIEMKESKPMQRVLILLDF